MPSVTQGMKRGGELLEISRLACTFAQSGANRLAITEKDDISPAHVISEAGHGSGDSQHLERHDLCFARPEGLHDGNQGLSAASERAWLREEEGSHSSRVRKTVLRNAICVQRLLDLGPLSVGIAHGCYSDSTERSVDSRLHRLEDVQEERR